MGEDVVELTNVFDGDGQTILDFRATINLRNKRTFLLLTVRPFGHFVAETTTSNRVENPALRTYVSLCGLLCVCACLSLFTASGQSPISLGDG